ncbi:hypothetical protein E1262_12205 [Jiangella aurantiaca]|uniref:Uncharacterized protein n=1 Tax=Jiangella aurantiaca TaxID=2530373 RepID=A0A4R5AEW6_9ACTN|nr:hypothetical protein [Jiangella aurantiaca]TDD69709.1 hypothetical protein E1262_12205 [Jiangella aurantiaca]
MSAHKPLGPLRRWLVDEATPQRLILAFILAVLALSSALAMLADTQDTGRSEMIEIEGPARTG